MLINPGITLLLLIGFRFFLARDLLLYLIAIGKQFLKIIDTIHTTIILQYPEPYHALADMGSNSQNRWSICSIVDSFFLMYINNSRYITLTAPIFMCSENPDRT